MGNRVWEMWIWGPRVVDWGFWAEGENPRDVDGDPGLEVLVPGFGIRLRMGVLGWELVLQLQNLQLFPMSPDLP